MEAKFGHLEKKGLKTIGVIRGEIFSEEQPLHTF
jgi:hypothetical protein